MQRVTWTDERLDDLARNMDAGFDRVERQFQQVDRRFELVDERFEQVDRRFEQVDRRFEQVDRRFDKVDHDIRELGQDLRLEIGGLRGTLVRVGIGIVVSLVGVIAAIGANPG